MSVDIEDYKSGQHLTDEICTLLSNEGVDLNREQVFAFYLYVASQALAIQCKQLIVTANLDCEVEIEEDMDNTDGNINSWQCYVVARLIPAASKLQHIGDLLVKLAHDEQGEFDGWEILPAADFSLENSSSF